MSDKRRIGRSGWFLLPTWLVATAVSLAGCGPGSTGGSVDHPEGGGSDGSGQGAPGGGAGAGGGNLIKNSTFNDGTSLPWTSSFSAPADGKASVINGAFCLQINHKGANAWDAQVRHREMVIRNGHTYSIRFKAYATAATTIRPKIGMAGPPYAEYWVSTIQLTTSPQIFAGQFTMNQPDDPTVELAFHMGGNLAGAPVPFSVCFDDVELRDPQFVPPPAAAAVVVPSVRVNQVGYLPALAKFAAVKTTAASPIGWELLSESGSAVAKGTTIVHGTDRASGDPLHIADFSSYTVPGKDYTLKVGEERSYPFDIRKDIYGKLKYDALAYFYHNRSGLAITMPYAGREQWTRPAGHLSDKSVPCAPGSGCTYSLDVTGGWYDAGDHGKYVVNGGIAVWTMLNQVERARQIRPAATDFADGKLSIPENKNGVPDILDEARWQIEFMLKMQVPAGNALAGMVHHKIHDEKWTALGLAPHEDPMKRYLRPPSTAATLNLAAAAAQAARIWKTIDPAFSAKCLAAAERAWTAAQAHPALYAPGNDNTGGGPYDDKDVTDEFYWAAVELYITTTKDPYKDFVTRSPHYKSIPGVVGGAGGGLASAMTWQTTQALGTISLAVVPNALDRAAAKASITRAADAYLDTIETEGYRLPMKPGPNGKYPWGSNSFVLNNAILLALAHDFTGKVQYVNGVVQAMDYILGRNALAQSYVTGYGDNPLKNPHHRFWSRQVNDKYPAAPPGAVSGGPNSGLEDPYVQAAGLSGCAPQKCFTDHIEAWSANEITINWNAPFAWGVAFLDEKGAP